ncbi:MAG: hypothetical protein ACFCUN_01690 [Hyphomicrobiaceae bacterium]
MPQRSLIQTLLSDAPRDIVLIDRTYAPSGWQRTFFGIAFLLLLPFYASLPPMFYQRVVGGVWLDTWGLIVIALAFTVIMALVVFELVYAIRARVTLERERISFTLPQGGPGAVPHVLYRTADVPYSEIRGVERIVNIYGGMIAPVRIASYWLNLDGGRRVLLGSLNLTNTDHIFPFEQIAREVAMRAGVEYCDRGLVKRRVSDAVLGLNRGEPVGTPLPETALSDLNARHQTFVVAMISLLVFVMGLGLAADMLASGVDLGERAPNTLFHWPQ